MSAATRKKERQHHLRIEVLMFWWLNASDALWVRFGTSQRKSGSKQSLVGFLRIVLRGDCWCIFRTQTHKCSQAPTRKCNGGVFRWIVYFAESLLLATGVSLTGTTYISWFRRSSSMNRTDLHMCMWGEAACFRLVQDMVFFLTSGKNLFAFRGTFANVMSWNEKCKIMTVRSWFRQLLGLGDFFGVFFSISVFRARLIFPTH